MTTQIYGQMCHAFLSEWPRGGTPSWDTAAEILAKLAPLAEYVSVLSLAPETCFDFQEYAPAWKAWAGDRFGNAREIFTAEQIPPYGATLQSAVAQPCGVYGYSSFPIGGKRYPAENLFLPVYDRSGADAMLIFATINPGIQGRVPEGLIFATYWLDLGVGVPSGAPFPGI